MAALSYSLSVKEKKERDIYLNLHRKKRKKKHAYAIEDRPRGAEGGVVGSSYKSLGPSARPTEEFGAVLEGFTNSQGKHISDFDTDVILKVRRRNDGVLDVLSVETSLSGGKSLSDPHVKPLSPNAESEYSTCTSSRVMKTTDAQLGDSNDITLRLHRMSIPTIVEAPEIKPEERKGAEKKDPQKLHSKLLRTVSDDLSKEEFRSLMEACNWLSLAQIDKIKTPRHLLHQLQLQGFIKLGNYTKLIELLQNKSLTRLLKEVERRADEIGKNLDQPPKEISEEMPREHRTALQRNRGYLIRNLVIEEGLLDYLLKKKVISVHLKETIDSHKTDKDKISKLLDCLPRLGYKAFGVLIKYLKKEEVRQKHVADKLESSLKLQDKEAKEMSKEMSKEQRDTLQVKRDYLIRNLIIEEGILDYLLKKKVISGHLKEIIDSQKTEKDKIGKLLDNLPKLGGKAFGVLIKYLRKEDVNQRHVAEELESSLKCHGLSP